MKTFCSLALAGMLLLGAPLAVQAHFGMIIPSAPTVMEMSEADIALDVLFWHPFENIGMNMERPKSFQVFTGGQAVDLLPRLKEGKLRDFKKWTLNYKTERPGLYVFAMEPAPYWEEEEDKFIIHFTKTYISAFGDDDGWNEPVGLKTEIVPLTNPTGLYAGGIFTGRVLLDGKPVPGSLIEVEWYPGPDKQGQAPYETMIAQSVMADDNGLFSFSVPKSGWWGFAALNDADFKLKREGQDKEVELGAVIWAYFHDMRDAVPYKGN